jgi:hypothetical protein
MSMDGCAACHRAKTQTPDSLRKLLGNRAKPSAFAALWGSR